MTEKTVVLLVDDRRRDLLGNVLIARHLKAAGVRVFLEPINAWQAVLGAHKPDLIVFNHLGAEHLANYSKRLHELGVLTAVLPNEGILYKPDVLEYSSKSYFPGMHCDYYFCWNRPHQEGLIRNHFCADPSGVRAVGVPRFDFYQKPWRKIFEKPRPESARPRLLVCGNFPIAHYHELPPEFGDRFFGRWTDGIPSYRNYRDAIRANFDARIKYFKFVDALARTGKYDMVLRPHPRETGDLYNQCIAQLPASEQPHVRLAQDDNIAELILNSDMQVSCEHCTTALENWIVDKPTIELVSEKNPFWHFEERDGLNLECTSPADLPAMVEDVLKHPAQAEYKAKRHAHLEKWVHTLDGTASKQVADNIVQTLAERKRASYSLDFNDWRRKVKWTIFNAFDEPYTCHPWLKLRHKLSGGKMKYTKRMVMYQKSIKPAEVRQATAMLDAVAK